MHNAPFYVRSFYENHCCFRYSRRFLLFSKSIAFAQNADVVIHCGDSRGEIEKIKDLFPDKVYVCVKGNCDLGSTLNYTQTENFASKKFFVTHGHNYQVKYTLYNLVCAAREQKADIVCFGHTHNAVCEYEDGLYIINPGSLNGYDATYAIIEIKDNGILANIAKLK